MYSTFPITTICGSMRFYREMLELAKHLSREGYIVLMPFVTVLDRDQKEPSKVMLDKMHFAKIDLSDSIHVVTQNPEERYYIGESTRNEINYARRCGKSVVYV
jgi:adenylylsulfate kinase-like enzyme